MDAPRHSAVVDAPRFIGKKKKRRSGSLAARSWVDAVDEARATREQEVHRAKMDRLGELGAPGTGGAARATAYLEDAAAADNAHRARAAAEREVRRAEAAAALPATSYVSLIRAELRRRVIEAESTGSRASAERAADIAAQLARHGHVSDHVGRLEALMRRLEESGAGIDESAAEDLWRRCVARAGAAGDFFDESDCSEASASEDDDGGASDDGGDRRAARRIAAAALPASPRAVAAVPVEALVQLDAAGGSYLERELSRLLDLPPEELAAVATSRDVRQTAFLRTVDADAGPGFCPVGFV